MQWIVVVAAGAVALLTFTFWQQIVTWANQRLATWLAAIFGKDLLEAFLLVLAGLDKAVVSAKRAAELLRTRLVSARLIFRRATNGQAHEKILEAEVQKEDGEIVKLEAAELVAWHELPDEVREKFIRRQMENVTMELKIKE